MSRGLTERQREVLEFLRDKINDGFPPTFREIAEHFGIKSTNGVHSILVALEKKGYIRKLNNRSRGFALTELAGGMGWRLPLVGRVAAGSPILAEENIEGHITIDDLHLKDDDMFALRVHGDSMQKIGIMDGDKVIVRRQETAEMGDIVVARIDDEATVKRYFPEGDRIRLQPENDTYDPIIVQESDGDFHLDGKVVGLIRNF